MDTNIRLQFFLGYRVVPHSMWPSLWNDKSALIRGVAACEGELQISGQIVGLRKYIHY